MKFLCVDCDSAMKLQDTVMHEEQGSLSVIYACPECGRKTAMLTNRGETQLVASLGIKIGPRQDSQAAGGGCPFSAMLQGEDMQSAGGGNGTQPSAHSAQPSSSGPLWTPEANRRLENVPEFVRPMAKTGIEQYAQQHGHLEITIEVLDKARAQFGF